jgi:hypothetical protein
MPCSPKAEGGVIVAHTTEHILLSFNSICHGPETEETPWDKKLELADIRLDTVPLAILFEG